MQHFLSAVLGCCLLVCAGLLAASPASAAPQDETQAAAAADEVALTGKVVDADGKPIEGIEFYPSNRVTPDGSQHMVYPVTAQRAKTLWKKTDADGRAPLTAFRPKDKAVIMAMIDGSLRELRFDVGDKREIDVPVRSAGRTEPRPAPDARLVDWVKAHSVPFKSIDPADADFGDLAPLKAVIGDARIVLLGEQSHGDGAAFHAKTRLIRFLHQEMGFDVLAFESGLYDCRRAWRAFREGQTPLTAAQLGIFGIWTGSTEVQPLIEYLGSSARTERPLELAGFDDQMTALASRRHLVEDVKSLAAKLDDKAIDAATLALFSGSVETLGRSEPLAERFDARWLSDKRPASPLGYGPLVADWTQVFDAVVFIRTMYPSTRFEAQLPKDRK